MNKLAKNLVLVILLISPFLPGSLKGQEVYPGDVNNNGIANAVDLLYLGVAYGNTGPERDQQSNEWEAQPITTLWGQSFPNGLNYAYADCDGDGVIDEEDIDDSILENFGLTHGTVLPDGYNNGAAGSAPVLELIPSTSFANAGSTVNIDIVLGSENMPVQDFYGLAFTMTYDSELIQEEDEIELDLFNNSWIDPTNGSLSRNLIYFDESGHAEIGFTRINQQTISEGFGTIASFSIVIEDDIASNVDTLHIEIDSIKLVGGDLGSVSIFPKGTFILVAKDTLLNTSPQLLKQEPKLFPNPAQNVISVVSPLAFNKLSIFNTIGQNVFTESYPYSRPFQKLILQLPDIPDGIYILLIETDDGTLTKEFIIHH